MGQRASQERREASVWGMAWVRESGPASHRAPAVSDVSCRDPVKPPCYRAKHFLHGKSGKALDWKRSGSHNHGITMEKMLKPSLLSQL